jgi:hypothetical protein
VGSVLKPDVCTGVSPGDTISKINGMPVAGTNFQGIIARIKLLPRPIIIHFISVIGGAAGSLTDDATGAAAAAAAPSSSSATSPLPKSASGPSLEAYQEESEVSPLDQGPRTKKPDLFDAAYHNDRGDVVSFGHNASATKKAPAPAPVDNGPTQSEITAAKQAELSEASRKALEALARMDEKDDDLLFGGSSSSSSATKRSDRSLFGSSSSGRAAVVDKDEDLFAPLVKKTPASPVPTPAAAPTPAPAAVAPAPAPAPAPLPVPVSVQQAPVVPPSPPASPPKPVAATPEPVVAVVEEALAVTPEPSAVDQPAAIQIDPFADDFVEPVVAPVSPAPAAEPPAPTTPAQPVPLGWDD